MLKIYDEWGRTISGSNIADMYNPGQNISDKL